MRGLFKGVLMLFPLIKKISSLIIATVLSGVFTSAKAASAVPTLSSSALGDLILSTMFQGGQLASQLKKELPLSLSIDGTAVTLTLKTHQPEANQVNLVMREPLMFKTNEVDEGGSGGHLFWTKLIMTNNLAENDGWNPVSLKPSDFTFAKTTLPDGSQGIQVSLNLNEDSFQVLLAGQLVRHYRSGNHSMDHYQITLSGLAWVGVFSIHNDGKTVSLKSVSSEVHQSGGSLRYRFKADFGTKYLAKFDGGQNFSQNFMSFFGTHFAAAFKRGFESLSIDLNSK
jgi:AraC-like DNA-binding protein